MIWYEHLQHLVVLVTWDCILFNTWIMNKFILMHTANILFYPCIVRIKTCFFLCSCFTKKLAGGFIFFHPYLNSIFQMGWNQQLENIYKNHALFGLFFHDPWPPDIPLLLPFKSAYTDRTPFWVCGTPKPCGPHPKWWFSKGDPLVSVKSRVGEIV